MCRVPKFGVSIGGGPGTRKSPVFGVSSLCQREQFGGSCVQRQRRLVANRPGDTHYLCHTWHAIAGLNVGSLYITPAPSSRFPPRNSFPRSSHNNNPLLPSSLSRSTPICTLCVPASTTGEQPAYVRAGRPSQFFFALSIWCAHHFVLSIASSPWG